VFFKNYLCSKIEFIKVIKVTRFENVYFFLQIKDYIMLLKLDLLPI